MPNKVYLSSSSKRALNNRQILQRAIKFLKEKGHMVHPELLSIDPYEFAKERLQGSMCACEGNGKFILEPIESCDGGKYMMKCKKCGEYSHL